MFMCQGIHFKVTTPSKASYRLSVLFSQWDVKSRCAPKAVAERTNMYIELDVCSRCEQGGELGSHVNEPVAGDTSTMRHG